MADYAEIVQLLHRYCYAHDARDPEALAACFAKDATFLGAQGRDNIIEVYRNGWGLMTHQRRHMLNNIVILEDGDNEVLTQSYITLYLVKDGKLETHLTGIYRDRVVREDGAWKLLSREAEMDVAYEPGDVPLSAMPQRS